MRSTGSATLDRHWLFSLPRGRFTIPTNFLAVAAATGILLITAWKYWPFIADDALISLRYGERLLAGSGLTFTDGEHVEGYSSLLWVLLVAGGGLFTSDLILVARVLGFLCLIATLVAIVRAHPISRTTFLSAIAGLAIVAFSHGPAIWAIGGLEQPLEVALLAWTLSFLSGPSLSPRRLTLAGGLLALLVLTRPDGALLVALTAVGLFVADRTSALSTVARISWLPAVAWLGQLAFRLWYYSDWLPNPAYVKLSWSVRHAVDGLAYVWTGLERHSPVAVLALAGLIAARPLKRRDVTIPLVVGLGWAAYVALIGGDLFPGRRHFLPALICLTFLVMATWRNGIGKRSPVIQAAILAVASLALVVLQRGDPENLRAKQERWEWDCANLASTLRTAFDGRRPLLAADPVGCMGYFSKLPTLDLMGLNDRHIARTKPADFGQGWIGHELGDGPYVLARAPDLVLLCTPAGSAKGCFRSGVELVALPAFRAHYVLINVGPAGAATPSRVWVQTESPRIGVMHSAYEVRIPGYLFASAGSTAQLSPDGRLVARMARRSVARFDRLSLEAGEWTVHAVGSPDVRVAMDGRGLSATTGQGGDLEEVVLTR